MIRILAAVATLLFFSASSALAQNRAKDVLKSIEARIEPANAKPGDVVTWTLTVQLANSWHTFPTRQADSKSGYVSRFAFQANPGLSPIEDVADPDQEHSVDDPETGLPIQTLEGRVVWTRKFAVSPNFDRGRLKIDVTAIIQVCNDRNCLPAETINTTANLQVGAEVQGIQAEPEQSKPTDNAPQQLQLTGYVEAYRKSLEKVLASLEANKATQDTSLVPFLLTAVFWGGLTLLTPCVFPMIPITVSFFLKQSEKQNKPLLLALVYCGTIILVLGGASLTLLGFFTALAVNPWMNAFLGLLFVVLALSLFGMFELTLPSSLTRFTSSREGQGGIIGTIFMALTFTIVSFTCVAPFLGGFGGMAAQGQRATWELILAALAFAATFAFPFFLLALFPSLIRRLPKSGAWLNTVKVVMAFIEIAAALKFFRTAELITFREPVFFTYDFVLAMWVALCLLCGFYLCRLIRIGHHGFDDVAEVSVPRFLVGFAFVSLAFYLLPALFAGPNGSNHRPNGAVFAWIDSFLLPDSNASHPGELEWSGDLEKAIERATQERRKTKNPAYVFVDFTGETCTNCKLNERTVFIRPEIKEAFGRYQLVQLYTDKVPDKYFPANVRAKMTGTTLQQECAEINRWFQDTAFQTQQLPLYVILEPQLDGRITASAYDEGKINKVDVFLSFLKNKKTTGETPSS